MSDSKSEVDEIIGEVLIEGLVDWTDPGWVLSSVVQMRPGTATEERDEALTLIRAMLTEGFATAGGVDPDGNFVAWCLSPDKSADKIDDEFIREWGTELPTPGAISWFQNTALGDEIANRIIKNDEHGRPSQPS
ncbi:hypothetical protein [Acidipropionibacterium virtanenii]|uniref:Uncharacterized protein n=1 Tax=Acidipropionibacterium virtanenii TaxID=2057246 RepID=A0A344UQ88_9ACTN|nr:hypothetical protein [Acidipropionibacterium virtanenii]AXE37436.1 hypothetical protein JS278_00239 [Acidipropionibacterium virtanenii]